MQVQNQWLAMEAQIFMEESCQGEGALGAIPFTAMSPLAQPSPPALRCSAGRCFWPKR